MGDHQLDAHPRRLAIERPRHHVAEPRQAIGQGDLDPAAANRRPAQTEHLLGGGIEVARIAVAIHGEHPGRQVPEDGVVVHPHAIQLARGPLEVLTRALDASAEDAGQHANHGEERDELHDRLERDRRNHALVALRDVDVPCAEEDREHGKERELKGDVKKRGG